MHPPPPPGSSRDRALGALVGLACGDAVGTTVEFLEPGSFEPLTDMVGGGHFGLAAGEWTDDTSMALCLAESLLDTGTCDLSDQMRRYLLWKDQGYLSVTGSCFDIGYTTSTQLERFRSTGEPVDRSPDPESAANGSLMRLAPVAVRWFTDLDQVDIYAAASSSTTHGAPRPVDSCRLHATMTAALIGGASWQEVTSPGFFRWGDLHPQVAAIAAGSYRSKPDSEIRGTGFCIDALEAALWAVDGADDFGDAVLRAANLGDDADTTAAIAGQLAGARWGLSGIPSHWLDRLAWRSRIESLADGLYRAATDEPLPSHWPFDRDLHAWWVAVGGLLAGEYPGDTDAALARRRIDLLLDAGVRTFVDLTSPADGLAPYGEVVSRAAAERGIPVERVAHPIPDFGVVDDDGYDQILDTIAKGQRRGAAYVHCWGGVGRTGTVVGTFLIGHGIRNYAEVIAHISALRAGTRKADRPSPETDSQRDVLRRRAAGPSSLRGNRPE